MKYFICGFSGSGKSTMLKDLAIGGNYPGYLFVDLDDFILAKEDGYTALGDLIVDRGWEWFRKTERETLMNLLVTPNIWIALGGGTLTTDLVSALSAMDDVKGYWLDVPFATCWERIQSDSNRPLVQKGEDLLRQLYKERTSLYSHFERLRPQII